MSRAWPVLAIVALLWPARTLGWLDGIPLNGSIEAVLLGLVAPALWWLGRGVFSRKWAQLAVVALIALKAGSLVMTPQGLCGRFFTAAPFRGECHDDLLPGLRHLTIDRAIYWFDLNEAEQRVRVLAIFFGSQDHVRHMLTRLLTP